jgi:hypothetical protein
MLSSDTRAILSDEGVSSSSSMVSALPDVHCLSRSTWSRMGGSGTVSIRCVIGIVSRNSRTALLISCQRERIGQIDS